MSIENKHREMVKRLVKPGAEILKDLPPDKVDLWHAMTGIASEVGELFDAVKAHVVYGKPLDLVNIREELGDLEFYLEQFRTNPLVLVSRNDTLLGNLEKLAQRYKDYQYTDTAALARQDKR